MSEMLEDSTDSFSYSMKDYDNSIVEGNSLKILNQKSSITTNSLSTGIKVENLSHAILIQSNELDDLIKALLETEDYDERMKIIQEKKDPFLFSSSCLIKILNTITSVKTKLAIVTSLGPRLIDPKEKSTEIIDIFRFAEEKEKVQEMLKSRLNTLSSSHFTKIDTSSALSPRLSEKSTHTPHLLSPRVSLLARPSTGSRPVSFDHTNSVRLSTSSSSAPASSLLTNNTINIKPAILTNSSTVKVSVVTPSSTPPLPEPIVSSSSSTVATINPSIADRPRSNKTPLLPEPLTITPATSSTSNNNNNNNNNNKDITTTRSDSNVSATAATANNSRFGSNAKQTVLSLPSSSLASETLTAVISTTAQNNHITTPTIATSSSIAKTHPSTTIPPTIATASVSKLVISTAAITNTAAQSVTSPSSSTSALPSSSKKNKSALAAENLALLNTKIATAFSEVSPRPPVSTATTAFVPSTNHTVKSTPTSSPRPLLSSAVVVNNENNNGSRNVTAASTPHQKDSHIVSVDDGTAALTLSYKPASIKSNNTSVLSLLTGKNK